jgi:hypothetical protein
MIHDARCRTQEKIDALRTLNEKNKQFTDKKKRRRLLWIRMWSEREFTNGSSPSFPAL